MDGKENNIINKPISINSPSEEVDMDELYFNTRPRTHKLALRKWLYNNDGSIPKIKKDS